MLLAMRLTVNVCTVPNPAIGSFASLPIWISLFARVSYEVNQVLSPVAVSWRGSVESVVKNLFHSSRMRVCGMQFLFAICYPFLAFVVPDSGVEKGLDGCFKAKYFVTISRVQLSASIECGLSVSSVPTYHSHENVCYDILNRT